MSTPNADYAPAVLAVLRREAVPLRPTEVAEWAGLTFAQAYGALRRLQRQGVVERNENNYWQVAQIDGGERQ